MDGNFKLVPRNLAFQQLYVIRGDIDDTATTLVYALMERLDQQSYAELFEALIQECGGRGIVLGPRKIHCDFELAVLNAISIAFPRATLVGCFYHLCQVSRSDMQQFFILNHVPNLLNCLESSPTFSV